MRFLITGVELQIAPLQGAHEGDTVRLSIRAPGVDIRLELPTKEFAHAGFGRLVNTDTVLTVNIKGTDL